MPKRKNPVAPVTPVTIVTDPFQINTLDIAEAQDQTDELPIDQDLLDPDLVDKELEDLGNAIRKAQAESEAQAQEAIQASVDQEQAELERRDQEDLKEDLKQDLAQKEAQESEENPEKNPEETQSSTPTFTSDEQIQASIEALLFMSEQPLKPEKLRELLGQDSLKLSQIKDALSTLIQKYELSGHGIEIDFVAGGYQFRTKASQADVIRRMAKVQTYRLSSGAMESLALVAYKQPVMKETIDEVRGVDSSHFLKILMERGLIEVTGRSELPGRPMLYSTTPAFLQIFGLGSLSDLPNLAEIESLIPKSEVSADDNVDPKVREMRKLVNQMNMDSSVNLQYDPREDEAILQGFKSQIAEIKTSTETLDALQGDALKAAPEAPLAPAPAQELIPNQEVR